MIRLIDLIASFFGLLIFSPVMIVVLILGYFDTGAPIFVQERVGKRKKPFNLIKFRTMPVHTASVASHLVTDVKITQFGLILRKTKLDELPQLINVLKGEMSLVGPRPNLFNQDELIKEREALDVYQVLPGITGLAQVNNIDMSDPKRLAVVDKEMIDSLNLANYFKYVVQTVVGKGTGDAVR